MRFMCYTAKSTDGVWRGACPELGVVAFGNTQAEAEAALEQHAQDDWDRGVRPIYNSPTLFHIEIKTDEGGE